MTLDKDTPSRGRPMSDDVDARVFDAAFAVLDEQKSFGDMSIELLCSRARISKASFYRRWTNRDDFILDLIDRLRPAPSGGQEDGGLRDDLVEILKTMFGSDLNRIRAAHAALILEGRKHPEILSAYGKRIAGPRRAALTERIRRGVEAGDLSAETDIAILAQMLSAAMLRVILVEDPEHPIPADYVSRVVDQALRGAGT